MDTQCDFRASFGYAFLDLVILLTVTRGFHWRRVSNKPARRRFSVEVMHAFNQSARDASLSRRNLIRT